MHGRLANDAYLAHRGMICPVCGSAESIEGDGIEVDDLGMYQQVRCTRCGSAWLDIYKLAGYTELQVGPYSPADFDDNLPAEEEYHAIE